MRRYWHDALPGKPKKSSDKTPAEIGLDYCNQLFKLEKEYADLDADTRKTRRLETEPLPYGRLTGHGLKQWTQLAEAVWPKQ